MSPEPEPIELVPLGRMTIGLRDPMLLPGTPGGTFVIAELASAHFEGERLKADAKGSANADWLTIGADGTAAIDVRVLLETDDGALIYLQYAGPAEPGRPDRHRRSAVPDRRRALRLAQRRAGRRQGQDRRHHPGLRLPRGPLIAGLGSPQTNDVSSVRPRSGCGPVAIVWALPHPVPPPTGSSTRITVSRSWWRRWAASTRRAVTDVLTVEVEAPTPELAVPLVVEPEVEAGAQVEAGLVQRRDREGALDARRGRAVQHAAPQPPVDGVERQLGDDGDKGLPATVGVLDPTLGRHLPVVADRVLLVEDVQGVRLAVVRSRRASVTRGSGRPGPGPRPGSGRRRPEPRPCSAPPRSGPGSRTRCSVRSACARRRPRPSRGPHRCGGSGRCRRRSGSRPGPRCTSRFSRAGGTAPSKVHSKATGTTSLASRAKRTDRSGSRTS